MQEPELIPPIDDSDIAIIGISCRFSGARDVETFWNNLRSGIDAISFFSDQELLEAGVAPDLLRDPNYVKAGFILPELDRFDAAFFGLSPRDAEVMDPQHRLFLEHAWQALEDAGYNPDLYQGSIGIYGGCGLSTYLDHTTQPHLMPAELSDRLNTFSPNLNDFLTTRVSYKLNLRGPSVNVQTACSTSLVAVHMACQSLLNGECHLTLAGGVTAQLPQHQGYLYREGLILSPDGHCRTFDAQAQGTVDGSGVGLVVLKRLEDALEDGDHVYAVIKGSAINNDGSLKMDYMAPSVNGQAAVIAEALDIAGVSSETLSYLEAHGTGTRLGDPIEITALTQAFQTDKKGFCAIGSVKTNIGHTDTAAGVAGLIKTVLALQHRQIPASLHFQKPNPQINFEDSPFYVNTQLSDWPASDTPRRAGVSAFGIGGTNAHVILEEAPAIAPSGPSRPWQLLTLSAKTASALETTTQNLSDHLQRHPDTNLADTAYTLQVGRQDFNHRRILVCQNIDDAIAGLSDPQRLVSHVEDAGEPPVGFMFSGQGAQYVKMSQELYQLEPTFQQQVDHCAEILRPHLGHDLRHILYPDAEQSESAQQRLQQTAFTQPALFVIEYALAQLWQSWGIQPQAMIGHSIGEYVAACLAGVFSLEDALALVATRGQLMGHLPAGNMLALPLSEADVQPWLNQELSLASINGPQQCVVSGSADACDDLHQQLVQQGVTSHRLSTSHAFHSAMMDPILDIFTERVRQLPLQPPRIPYLSNVTGDWITAAEATDPSYWAKHLRQTVRFANGLKTLLTQHPDIVLLEVGPGLTLSRLAKQQREAAPLLTLSSLRHAQDQQSDMAYLLNTLGHLYLARVPIDWAGFYNHERRYRLSLPTYPFERQRYWLETQPQAEIARSPVEPPDKQRQMDDWFYLPSWKRSPLLSQNAQPIERPTNWLLFIDDCGVGSTLATELQQSPHSEQVTIVHAGSKFSKANEAEYTLNPNHPSDYELLVNDLSQHARMPQSIVHCWSVTQSHDASLASHQPQTLGFHSLLYLSQAMGKLDQTHEIDLTVVSNHVQDVTGEETLYPEKATILGPVLVIPQEYPNISCRSVDVVLRPEDGQQQQLAKQLVTELLSRTSDRIIAYRGPHRSVQVFEPTPLAAPTSVPHLREGGVYLITHGLEGIGLTLAAYLARTLAPKLILIDPSPHESKENPSQPTVQLLEQHGAEVLVLQAEVTDLNQMQNAITQSLARFGQINGVIHAAEYPDGSLIQLRTAALNEAVLAPKIHGTRILETVLQQAAPLDFVVLCSSLASLLAPLGQVGYGAANAFLDSFAHVNTRSHGTFTVSINWDAWPETQTASEIISPQPTREDTTPPPGLSPADCAEVFSRILGANQAQVIVSVNDLQGRLQELDAAELPSAIEPAQRAEPAHPRPQLESDYLPPSTTTEQRLAELWQELLGIEQIGIQDNFFELGGDSLLATQTISRLRQTFQIDLPIGSLFEQTTISELAGWIEMLAVMPASSELAADEEEEEW